MKELCTPHHHALLNALRTQDLLPPLIQRLSQERIRPDDADLQRLRDWPQALMESPAWPVLKDALTRPEAWPEIWHKAQEQGFSERAHHHHALFFMDLSHTLRMGGDLDVALWSLSQALVSWAALAKTDYLQSLGRRVFPSAPTGLIDETLENLLKDDAQTVFDWVQETLKRTPPDERANSMALAYLGTLEDVPPHSMLKLAQKGAATTREKLGLLPGQQLRDTLAEQNFSVVDEDLLVAPFKTAADLARHLNYPDAAVVDLVQQAVDTCWALRKIDRDDIPAFQRIIEAITPINEILISRLLAGEVFGHNSRAADFLVFRAEPLNGSERQRLLERGRKVCPDHRNSSMLLSHLLLELAALHMITLVRVPRAAKNTAIPRKILKDIVVLLTQAEEVFPFNTKLDTVKAEFLTKCAHFSIDPTDLR